MQFLRKNGAFLLAVLAGAAGLFFASYSTHDFVQHLDRQVHGLHCSFLPGLAEADVSGESGCHVTLMSPYSSVLRESVWGGIPVSLPAMAVFAFLLAYAGYAVIAGRQDDRRATAFMLAAWGVPVLTSAVMGYLSIATLDAVCKLCIGIYASSAVGMVASIAALIRARRVARDAAEATEPTTPRRPELSLGAMGAAFVLGVVFVFAPVGSYAAGAPDFSRYVGSCGTLAAPQDPHRILIPVGPQTRPVPVIEVLDPLCPACKGFEARFDASSVDAQASRRVLLFPLDDQCNWMIDRAIHPGACAISEAVLCAEGDAEEVIEWAFANQTQILEASRSDPEAAARIARQQFPSLASCIGSATVRARLNQSLRWAVQNQLPVLTPQIYVGDLRLCDADTDLGMDYALTRMVERYRASPPSSAPREATVETGSDAERPAARPSRGPRPRPSPAVGTAPAEPAARDLAVTAPAPSETPEEVSP